MDKEKKVSKSQNNFIYLFFSLIFLLFGVSFMDMHTSEWSEEILNALTIITLLVSVHSLKTDNNWRRSVYALTIFFVLMIAMERLFDTDLHIYLLLVILFVFLIGSFLTAAKEVLFVGEIDFNSVIGSISLYLLLGLIWAVIYLFLLALNPGSFSGIETMSWEHLFPDVIYFSFVTLTTLGYGDILPSSHIAQFFVYMEAVTGVFYMAIIVASLVSTHLATSKYKATPRR